MRLSKRTHTALNDTIAKALRTQCVIRIYATELWRATEIFDAITPYFIESGAKPERLSLSFFFPNSSCVKIVIRESDDSDSEI